MTADGYNRGPLTSLRGRGIEAVLDNIRAEDTRNLALFETVCQVGYRFRNIAGTT